MSETDSSDARMIAPCGINCSVCYSFLREKNKCPGCWIHDPRKPKTRLNCIIKNCENLLETDSKFCYDCGTYPCKRIIRLDKRYSLKYKLSNIDNLKCIKDLGPEAFIQLELTKWKCNECGGTICVHLGYCMDCEKRN
jgi:hypothetical protein